METTAEGKDFWIDEPLWRSTLEDEDARQFDNEGALETSHVLDVWPSTSETTVQAFGKELAVDVVLVEEDRVKGAFVPPATKAALQAALEAAKTNFDRLATVLSSVTGQEVEIKPTLDLSGMQYNMEDLQSALYYTTRTTRLAGGIKVNLGDIPIPALSVSVAKVATIGVYVRPSFGLSLFGEAEYRKYVNEKGFHPKAINFGGVADGGVEVGGKVEVMPGNSALDVQMRVYWGLKVAGQLQYKVRMGDADRVALSMYLDPLLIGVQSEIKASGFSLLDIKVEDYIGDRIEFKNEW